ncbi:MAG: LPS export ABC transporter periplasmic protein LptC [Pseudomonadota bacterium]|nr:LPS export ABC transporter periplasmic protein LptC [Pseudomonadota bacterium]
MDARNAYRDTGPAGGKPAAGPVSRRPRSYSRFVTCMKVGLPLIALSLVGLLILWPQVKEGDVRLSVGMANFKAVNPGSPTMVNARFVGSDNRSQPFSITADLAKNLLLGKSAVELEVPKADLALRDGSWLAMTARTGLYDQKGKTLELEGVVNLFHDSGYEFNTEIAHVDLTGGVATGEKPVMGQGPFGQLAAEGFRIEKLGKRMLFTGKAKLTIFPTALEERR